jgi:hypothetical protein
MAYYCHLDSSGTVENTNFQLYSLTQAANSWNDLINEWCSCGDGNVNHCKERLAFILSCFRLSLSQLLGQNCPSRNKDKMAEPRKLLSNILKRANVDKNAQKRLNRQFESFLEYYNAIRHFGINRDNANYELASRIYAQSHTLTFWSLLCSAKAQ